PGVVVRLSTVLDVGLAATICSQRRDLGFEIREALEVAVHAGEPEVSDFVQVAQRRQNRQPDLVAGDLGTARGAELLLDALRQPSQGIFADSAPLAGATHTRDDLLAAERLGRPGTLHHGQRQLFDRREATLAGQALPAPTDDRALVGGSAVDHATVGVAAERAVHAQLPLSRPVEEMGTTCAPSTTICGRLTAVSLLDIGVTVRPSHHGFNHVRATTQR